MLAKKKTLENILTGICCLALWMEKELLCPDCAGCCVEAENLWLAAGNL